MWDITPNTTLRLAFLRTLKRSLRTDQTIEPTQVAGFNQFFDDFNGTKTSRYGVGLDQKFSSHLYGGLEISRRELEVPIVGTETSFIDWYETLYRIYLNWTPY